LLRLHALASFEALAIPVIKCPFALRVTMALNVLSVTFSDKGVDRDARFGEMVLTVTPTGNKVRNRSCIPAP
jgi:hypothetical protein